MPTAEITHIRMQTHGRNLDHMVEIKTVSLHADMRDFSSRILGTHRALLSCNPKHQKQEIHSVKHGICPIAEFTYGRSCQVSSSICDHGLDMCSLFPPRNETTKYEVETPNLSSRGQVSKDVIDRKVMASVGLFWDRKVVLMVD